MESLIMLKVCELASENATNKEIKQILSTSRVIAIVGLSDKPERDSYRVAAYLKEQGDYHIIPVNPFVTEVLGVKSYPSLRDVPTKIDVVDIFRRPEAVPEIVDDAIQVGAKVIWMQENIVHNDAAENARTHGLHVVMNKCIMKEHGKVLRQKCEDTSLNEPSA